MKSLAKTMKHVSLEGFGGPEVLKIKESSLPVVFFHLSYIVKIHLDPERK